LKALKDLAEESKHPELTTIPWALWGHSGGAAWVGFMTMRHPERVAAVWMNSGQPVINAYPQYPHVKYSLVPDEAYKIPMMCNLGTQEGVTVKDGKHARRWPSTQKFFHTIRSKGGLIGVAVDPLTGHSTGNQRYLAIPWFSACLEARLPVSLDGELRAMNEGDPKTAIWLPNKAIANAWEHYIRDTKIPDETRPPAPFNLKFDNGLLTWDAEADLESGIGYFIIERDGIEIAKVPEENGNPKSRPVFQNMRNSDTPTQPLAKMEYRDSERLEGEIYEYKVISVNTVGLKSVGSE